MRVVQSPSFTPGWKRILDVSSVALAAPLWIPLGLLIGGLIKILSPGPVIFRQERIGLRGRRFTCLKFRTMNASADNTIHHRYLVHLMKSNQPMTKLDHSDQRLIPGGWLLRSLGLDELPQLVNVLRGEMSLVGPRPCVPYEYERFQPRHLERCQTPPGLTGLWQVSGKNRTTFEEMMDLDIQYVRERCLGLDLLILAKTVPAIVAQACETRSRRRSSRASLPQNVELATTSKASNPFPSRGR